MTSRLGNALLTLLLVASNLAIGAEGIRWAPDLETARKAAAQYRVPLLIHFYGDNCVPCQTLEERVYTQPELIDTLRKYFICVKINASANRQIAAEFQVHSWPTDVFVSPDGKTLYQGQCSQTVSSYMGTLENVAVMNRDRNLMLAAQRPANPQNSGPGGSLQGALPGAQTGPQQSGMYSANPQHTAAEALAAQQAALRTLQQNGIGAVQTPMIPQQTATQPNANQITTTSPNYYTSQPSRTSVPGLGASSAPAADVSSGPLLVQNQPVTSTGSVQGAQQQIAGPGAPISNAANPGQLPIRQMVAQTTLPTSNSAGRGIGLNAYQSMPTMQTQSLVTQSPAAQTTPFRSAATPVGNTAAMTVSNPYYQQQEVTAPQAAHVAGQPTSQPAQGQMPTLQMPALNQGSRQNTELSANANVPQQQMQSSMPQLQLPQPQSTPNVMAAQPSETATTPTRTATNSLVGFTMPESSTETAMPTASEATLEFRPRNEVDASGPAGATDPETNTEASSESASNNADSDVKPAIEGYCPVTLQAKSEWILGDPQFQVKHRGKVYWLSSQTALDQFLATPDQCSPVLSGYDPYILLEEGKLVEGNIQFGLNEEISGQVLLFSSQESKQKYWEDFDRYSKALTGLLEKAGHK